jgi:hypothetical protein
VLEREFAERTFLFIEYVGNYYVHGGTQLFFNSGGGYRITPTQQTDFHYQRRLPSGLRFS